MRRKPSSRSWIMSIRQNCRSNQVETGVSCPGLPGEARH
jgi:hypothetical protein